MKRYNGYSGIVCLRWLGIIRKECTCHKHLHLLLNIPAPRGIVNDFSLIHGRSEIKSNEINSNSRSRAEGKCGNLHPPWILMAYTWESARHSGNVCQLPAALNSNFVDLPTLPKICNINSIRSANMEFVVINIWNRARRSLFCKYFEL